jgi:hypothetical protein
LRSIRRSAAALFAALVVGACNGDVGGPDEPVEQGSNVSDPNADRSDEPEFDDEPEPEPEPDPEPEKHEEPDDPATDDEPKPDGSQFAVPDDIDNSYVDLVVNHLLEQDSEVLESILLRDEGSELTDDEEARLAAVYSGSRLDFVRDDFSRLARGEFDRSIYRPSDEMGRARWSSRMLLAVQEDCVVSIGEYDLSERVFDQPMEHGAFFILSMSPSDGGSDHNESPWTMRDMNVLTSGGEPIPEESWGEVEFADALDNSCDEGP